MSEHPREIIPEKVIAALRQHAETVFGGRGVDVVYLYGSVATGLAHPFSDVDIALLVSEEKAAMTPSRLGDFERFTSYIRAFISTEEEEGTEL